MIINTIQKRKIAAAAYASILLSDFHSSTEPLARLQSQATVVNNATLDIKGTTPYWMRRLVRYRSPRWPGTKSNIALP